MLFALLMLIIETWSIDATRAESEERDGRGSLWNQLSA